MLAGLQPLLESAALAGMTFNPVEPTQFVLNVMHPDSTILLAADTPGFGFGDALWEIDIAGVIPPTCGERGRDGDPARAPPGASGRSPERSGACSHDDDFQFIRQLEQAGKPTPSSGR